MATNMAELCSEQQMFLPAVITFVWHLTLLKAIYGCFSFLCDCLYKKSADATQVN